MGNLADSSRISLIAALDENGLIGSNGALPWYLPKDLARFKTMTLGKTVLMGRATFKSIGAALPGRRNVVLSRRCSAGIEGCDVFPTIALALSSVQPAEEVMVIGGAQVYAALLSRADTLHLTRVHHCFEGDCYFPSWNRQQWKLRTSAHFPADAANPYSSTLTTYTRINQHR